MSDFDARRERKREYNKKWAANHPENLRAIRERYIRKHPERSVNDSRLDIIKELNEVEYAIPDEWNSDIKLKGLEDESF